jgi:RNA-binding protein
MALSSKQRRYLRSLAQKLACNYQIGKLGINESSLMMLDKALIAHELIKINLLTSLTTDKNLIANQLSTSLKAEIVQIIGHHVILFRLNHRHNRIKLPT